MTREEAKQVLPLLQALAEGKTIQNKNSSGWIDIDSDKEQLYLDLVVESPRLFRVKPEHKYRPFANVKECWEEMQKHQPFGWVKAYHGQFVITEIRDSKATIGRNDNFMDYDYILENYTFADGTPFGIKE